ncbi:MAG: DHA2 family efflux MFS transporter permease subunit [Pseudomonadota bacterium]|jgi:DHA2 family multidrug resistance protein|nr:DHA2 family efflux MFS transporter permease subunit [Pseudomonadota bacterium]
MAGFAPPQRKERSEGFTRIVITISIMLATLMNSLDTTIANVALPHIQGSVSASQDQITWVLTSYIVAAAIMTPLVSWLAGRFGRKMVFMVSIGGFVVASMLCGIAHSLAEIVIYRLLQGVFGAALIPLSQAVLLDIYPPRQHGQAMAVWGAGAILGPVLGPALGGWLTDNLSWNWVFFINLPIGILAFLGVFFFIHDEAKADRKPFDFFGFGSLAVAIGSAQLFLDRGATLDWFASLEVRIEALVALLSTYLFLVQIFTAKRPFISMAIFKDRNFVTASFFGFMIGILLFSGLALLPPMMENLLGYSVVLTGLVSMPRGIGSFAAMFVVGQLVGRIDVRLILLTGLGLSAWAVLQMSHFSLQMTSTPIIISGLLQGLGTGLLFVPLSTVAFSTLPVEFRTEAAGFYTLIRNIGSSVGISIMQVILGSNIEQSHADLVNHARADNPLLRWPQIHFDVSSLHGLALLNREITRQAAMVAYVDDFRLMLWITLLAIPLLIFMKPPARHAAPSGPDLHAGVE